MTFPKIVGVCIGITLCVPLFASADLLSDLQIQLKLFLAQLTTFQVQRDAMFSAAAKPQTQCPKLMRNLSRDFRKNPASDVRLLQQFLIAEGYLASGNDTGFFGPMTEDAVKKFQCTVMNICSGSPRENGYGAVGPKTRAQIASSCGVSSGATSDDRSLITPPTQTPAYVPSLMSSAGDTRESSNSLNRNLGTMPMRVIVVNIAETSTTLSSASMPFTSVRLDEAKQAMQRLDTFVRASSYGKASVQPTISGVYELGSGVCNHAQYGDKVNDLIQRSLIAADAATPLVDYTLFLIFHPHPVCSDGASWSYEGIGAYKEYVVNGRTLHLRSIHISDLNDMYLFHEFGHMLGYLPNGGIGHPAYMQCTLSTGASGETVIPISASCASQYDWLNGKLPVFNIMSGKSGILSDYSVVDKESIGWLNGGDLVTTSSGQYTLTALESPGGTKALKIPIPGTDYTGYVSFRQPLGYTYPSAPTSKPNGVIIDVRSTFGAQSFLITDASNWDMPLVIGKKYRLGANGPLVAVQSISGINAVVAVGSAVNSNATIYSTNSNHNTSNTSAMPSCTVTSSKSQYAQGEPLVFAWTSANASYAAWVPDMSGKDNISVSADKLAISGSSIFTWNGIGNPSVTLKVYNAAGQSAICTKSVSVISSTPAPTCTLTPSSPTPSGYTTGYDYSVKPYSSLTLTLASQNATYAVLNGEKQLANFSWVENNLTAITNDYSVTVYGAGGSASCSTKVYVDYKG